MSSPDPPPRRSDLLAWLAVVALAAAVLSPILGSGFLTDDYHYLRIIKFGPKYLGEPFDPNDATEIFKYFYTKAAQEFELYRPLVILSYGLNYRLAGTDPYSYQLADYLAHLIAGTLVFVLLRRLFPRLPSAAVGAGAAWFLLNPIQLEVVAWSATRSDGIAWVFGSLALITKLGRPSRCVLPALLCACALMGKESALVFFPACVLVDLLPRRPDDGWELAARVRRALRRSLPLIAVAAAYFAMRYALYGSLFQTNAYAKKEFESFWSAKLWQSYGRSLRTVAIPVSRLAFGDSWLRLPLTITLGAGFALTVILGLLELLRRRIGVIALVLLLFWLPFLLAATVNEISDRLVNTRAVYTPAFALAALLALTSARGRGLWRWLPAVLVLGSCIALSVPSQRLYVDAHRGVEESLASLREGARAAPAHVDDVIVLGYQERDYFEGGFTLSGAIRPALQRPFMSRDFHVLTVCTNGAVPARRHLTPFPMLFAAGDRDAAVLVTQRRDGGFVYPLAHRGPHSPVLTKRITLVSPAPGARLVLDPARPETLAPRFRFDPGMRASRYEIDLFNCFGRVFPQPLEVRKPEIEAVGKRRIVSFAPAIPPELIASLAPDTPLAWAVRAYNDGWGEVAASALRLVRVSPAP